MLFSVVVHRCAVDLYFFFFFFLSVISIDRSSGRPYNCIYVRSFGGCGFFPLILFLFSSLFSSSHFLHRDGDLVCVCLLCAVWRGVLCSSLIYIFTLLLFMLLLFGLVVMLICSHIINSANRQKFNSFRQCACGYGNAQRNESWILFCFK